MVLCVVVAADVVVVVAAAAAAAVVVVVVHDGSEYDDVKEVDCRNWKWLIRSSQKAVKKKVGTESVPIFHV